MIEIAWKWILLVIYFMEDSNLTQYVPIAIMFVVAVGFIGTTMVATHLLGPKRKTKARASG